uniref:Uncharacterized protein n=1 Tax=Desertifilum tharense IPPAS B-1220 TaxID=1781255 RepID=A0ACD5GN23_9CYAN
MITINSALFSPIPPSSHLPIPPSPHPPISPSPHLPIPPSSHPPILPSPTLFPTQHSALSTQHSFPHPLPYSALFPPTPSISYLCLFVEVAELL